MKSDPVPFELAEREGLRYASNGRTTVILQAEGATLKRRRGIKGISPKPPGETVLPMLNELAGEVLKRLDMPSEELAARVAVIGAAAHVAKPERSEWAVCEVDGIRIYVDAETVIVTRKDLMP